MSNTINNLMISCTSVIASFSYEPQQPTKYIKSSNRLQASTLLI